MSKKIDKIAAKKLELERNIARLADGLEYNLTEVKEEVSQSVKPTQVVKKYPLQVIGVAVLTGILLGYSKKRKTITSVPKSRISSTLGESIKKRLTQKALDVGLDYLENKLAAKKEVEL